MENNNSKQIGTTLKALITIASAGGILIAIVFGIFNPMAQLRQKQAVQAKEVEILKEQVVEDIAEIKTTLKEQKQILEDHLNNEKIVNEKLDNILKLLK